MKSQSSKADIVRSLIQNFFNAHDVKVAGTYFTDDFKWYGASVGHTDGVETYASTMALFFKALPDVHATEQDVITEGNKVVMRFIVEGTHKGDLWGIAATNNHVKWDALMTYTFVDEKISEQWAIEDWTAILTAVGEIRPPWLKS